MTATPLPNSTFDRCWAHIGVWGTQTCPELAKHTHCHNCPVFVAAGRSLFHQPAPDQYLHDWALLIAAEKPATHAAISSALVFRLGTEWLALASSLFSSVEEIRPIHRVPHRSNKVFLGLVNIQGGLHLCFSLRELLGIPPALQQQTTSSPPRLMVLRKENLSWVFPCDEILGLHQFSASDLQNVPATVEKTAGAITKALLAVGLKRAGLLDQELLITHLQRNALRP